MIFTPASQWTPFSIQIDSLLAPQFQPTTAAIYINMSSRDSSANPQSYFMLDSLHWLWGDTSALATGGVLQSPTPFVSIHPNPASSTLHFTLFTKENDFWLVSLYTLQGRKVKSAAVEKGNGAQISVDDLPPGTYYYNIAGVETHQNFSGSAIITH